MSKLLLVFIFSASLFLTGCVYHMDIDQGNRIDQDQLEQLEVGMTRRQVEFLLGTPVVDAPFHADQAHYIYYFFDGKEKTTEQKTMTLTYDNDVLVEISGAL